jgi:hypothetical protein
MERPFYAGTFPPPTGLGRVAPVRCPVLYRTRPRWARTEGVLRG